MGAGIITSNGQDPLVEYGLRMALFGSEQLSGDLRRIFTGSVITSQDGVLELTTEPVPASPPLSMHKLSIRRPNAPYVADIFLRPAEATDRIPNRDARSSKPSPDQWGPRVSSSDTTWELFNCVIHSLTSRRN